VSSGKANVLVGILRLSPGTESVTELTSGAKAARIKWMACAALAVDPLAVSGIERPRAVEFKATARADAGFFYRERIQRFDGMQADVCQARSNRGRGHAEILAEAKRRVTDSPVARNRCRTSYPRIARGENKLRQKRSPRSAIEMLRSVQSRKYSAKRSDLNSDTGDGFCVRTGQPLPVTAAVTQ